jgi:hypothetical protein
MVFQWIKNTSFATVNYIFSIGKKQPLNLKRGKTFLISGKNLPPLPFSSLPKVWGARYQIYGGEPLRPIEHHREPRTFGSQEIGYIWAAGGARGCKGGQGEASGW